MPIAEIAAGEIDGVIYTGGGFTPPAGSVSLWFGAYDTTDDAWQRRADLPLAVHHPGMVAAAGKVWQSGGYTAQLNVNNANRRLDAYDPARDAWTRMADMPGRRGAHAAVYIAGGEGAGEGGGAAATGRTYGEHYVFDPVVGSWHESAAMPTTRHGIAAAAVGQRFNVIGGGRIAGLDCSTLVEWWEPGRSGSVLLPFVARTGHAGDLRDLDPSPYRINNHPHYPIPIQRTEPCWKPAS